MDGDGVRIHESLVFITNGYIQFMNIVE